ncbi:hypothetical protein [Nocardia australiensis]|uniref:hypothetical protein n=1 Tax=Nocardia australiensis TaxID=2887191 RepID=UPI001D148DC6|nr:hypothetical protein [Nocardia australiensis]
MRTPGGSDRLAAATETIGEVMAEQFAPLARTERRERHGLARFIEFAAGQS